MSWRQRAKCKDLGPNIFFGVADEPHHARVKREAQAKAICRECEVAGDCLIAGQNEEGIWGGKTDSERRKAIQRSAPIATRRHQPVMSDPDANTAPWTLLESADDVMLFQRNSGRSWHGTEFLLVKSGILVFATFDLQNAYMRYHSLIQ